MNKNNIFLSGGLTIWLTGMSGAGKSTIANALKNIVINRTNNYVHILDGDEVRKNLSPDLDFSKEGRSKNIKRISYVSKCIVDCCGVSIVAAISPYKKDRQDAKNMIGKNRFFEVFVDCHINTLIERDAKGLYAKAISGQIENFTGISDPYECPERPHCVVDSGIQTLDESLEIIKRDLNEFLRHNEKEEIMYYI